VSFKPEGESVVEVVVRSVAVIHNTDPRSLTPLSEVVDPDALNRLFDGQADGSSSATVAFDYCDQQVTVTADAVQVLEADSTNG
jgi:hypothetical protein